MKIIKFKKYVRAILLLLLAFNLSCDEDDPQAFDTITYIPCEDADVVVNANIISDFECQANIDLSAVNTVRNPAEVAVNPSKFAGELIDGTDAWDALVIDYGNPIDFSTNGVLKIKIKTEVEGKFLAKLEGGTSTPVEVVAIGLEDNDGIISGDFKWTEYAFDFSNQKGENHTKLVIFFNAGVETSGTDVYYIDDLFWDTSLEVVDPCDGVTEDLTILNDFDCQQNFFIGNPADTGDDTTTPVADNPNKSGVNTSDNVGEYTDDGTNAWDNLYIDTGEEIDLVAKPMLSLKIHSSKTIPLLAKLEGGTQIEIWGAIDVTGEWKEYTFDFSAAAGNGNTRVVLFFNGGETDGTSEDIYYVDDIKFMEFVGPCDGVVEDLSIISDFECQQNFAFGNDGAPVIDNPNKSGENTSDSVGEFTDDGKSAWDNLFVDFGAEIDLSVNNQLNIKILSDRAVPLLAKLEGGTEMEIWGAIDVTGEWKNYTFDFSAAAGNGNTKVALFFNGAETDGTSQDIYYVDDIMFTAMTNCDEVSENCSGVAEDLTVINDFDCQQNYTGQVEVPVVQNPNVSCVNRSSNVGKFTDDGKSAWDNLFIDFGDPIDLTTHNQLKIKILSSKAVPLIVKIEGGLAPLELSADISVVDEWVEYTFDFSPSIGQANNKLVLFFNGGQTDGTSEDIYYIDNIRFVEK